MFLPSHCEGSPSFLALRYPGAYDSKGGGSFIIRGQEMLVRGPDQLPGKVTFSHSIYIKIKRKKKEKQLSDGDL